MMRWRKLGLIWKPKGDQTWARSHAMGPTPLLMPSGELRLFYSSLDQSGRGALDGLMWIHQTQNKS